MRNTLFLNKLEFFFCWGCDFSWLGDGFLFTGGGEVFYGRGVVVVEIFLILRVQLSHDSCLAEHI